jgi:PAS domain-containing protein
MNDLEKDLEARLRGAEERLAIAEAASRVGTFELGLKSGNWRWSPQSLLLFGLDPTQATSSFADWERVIFSDDVPKLRNALEGAAENGLTTRSLESAS